MSPGEPEEVAAVVGACYAAATPIVPRGGGTGYAGGAVPLEGGVVLSLERLNRIRSFDPLLWRMHVEAGVRGKVSEDIVVPVDRLREALAGTAEIAARHGLESCSWGHAGDGNLHATFLVDRSNDSELERAAEAAEELFELATSLGGCASGEHGVGLVKRGQLSRQWRPPAVALHEAIKQVFDPDNLLNPGKKAAN